MAPSQDKVAVITGASSGLGLVSAVALAREGWRVVASMRDTTRADRLIAAAQRASVAERMEVRRCDVTISEQVAELASGVERDFGRVDLLLNNAGFALAGLAQDVALSELRHQFETNFFAQVAVTQAILPLMRKQRSGKIVMMSSSSAIAAIPGVGAYSASKWAVEGWSEALRLELRPLGIWVSLIEPGAHESDIWERNSAIAANALTSVDAHRTRRFGEATQKMPKEDPENVARIVVRIARAARPKMRYPVGRMAKHLALVKLLTPWSAWERAVLHMTGLGE